MTMTTKSKTIHMRIDVRGAIMNWQDSEWRNCVTDDNGKTLTPQEVKRAFLNELAEGHIYLPMGDCEGFDYQKGCPGHPYETDQQQTELDGHGTRAEQSSEN